VIAAGESVSWQYAEPWFVLGPCLIHVPLGLLTWHVIRKRYSPLSVLNISKTSTPQP